MLLGLGSQGGYAARAAHVAAAVAATARCARCCVLKCDNKLAAAAAVVVAGRIAERRVQGV